MSESISKSKLKRLNKKAKVARVKAELEKEKSQKECIERSLREWKNKALSFRRKLNTTELKLIIHAQQSQGRQIRSRQLINAHSGVTSLAYSHTTPSQHTSSAIIKSDAVPVIPSARLSHIDRADSSLGSGRFGVCTQMYFKDMFAVCVKEFSESTILSKIRQEAAILVHLNDSEYTPYCFGVCEDKRAIITSYISVGGKALTLHGLLTNRDEDISLTPHVALDILSQIINGVDHIHTNGILHNDLKLDNIVLGSSMNRSLRAYIIDFGKACLVGKGKKYSLTKEEKKVYATEHTQIAPDLRDGEISQCTATDVFSLGRVFNKVNKSVVHSCELRKIAKQSLVYYSSERPRIADIVVSLTNIALL